MTDDYKFEQSDLEQASDYFSDTNFGCTLMMNILYIIDDYYSYYIKFDVKTKRFLLYIDLSIACDSLCTESEDIEELFDYILS